MVLAVVIRVLRAYDVGAQERPAPPAQLLMSVEPAAILQAAMAEFSDLRTEIQNRSQAAWTLVNLNVTATAAILGFVLSDKADPRLLLALPIVGPALGMLFIDHAYNINNLGSYINKRIRPVVRGASGFSQLLGYEEAMDSYEEKRLLRFIPFGMPLTIIFSGVPLASLGFVVGSLDAGWAWTVWGFGLLLVATQLTLWVFFLVNPQRLDPLRDST
jgi:hypothetical protein